MKRIISLMIAVFLLSSCNLFEKKTELAIEWKVVNKLGKNATYPIGLKYKKYSIDTDSNKVFNTKKIIKNINDLNSKNLELILDENQKNRWTITENNWDNITYQVIFPENNKKQKFTKIIVPITYKPFQVIFTDVVDGGIDRDNIFNSIEKVAENNDLYTYITNGIIKISSKDDKNCWKGLYNITETSLFNKIFDRINDFYDEFLTSNYYSENEGYDVHLVLSKYVYQFDNEKLDLLDKRLNSYKNIETKIYLPEYISETDTIKTYNNLEISIVDSSNKSIFDNK